MDRQHHKKSNDCKQSEELLPSQMTVEQFDRYLNQFSPKQIRHAMKEMAKEHAREKRSQRHLPATEIDGLRSGDRFSPPEASPAPDQRNYDVPPPPQDLENRSTKIRPEDLQPPAPTPAEPQFYGLNLGIVKLGVTDDGSLNAGVNIGIAKVDASVGMNTRVDAQAGFGELNAHTGAGVGLGSDGIHSDVYAGAKVFDAAHVDADFGAAVGPRTGVDGRLSANAGPIRFKMDTDHEIGTQGLYSGVDARVGVPDGADFHTGAHVGLNSDSSAGAGLGVQLGKDELDGGFALDTAGNTMILPRLYLDQRRHYYELEDGF